jgi:photosystem II stability/assembly factor-like uncharacterized protein
MKKIRSLALLALLPLALRLSGDEPSLLAGLKARRIGPAAMSGRITAIDCGRKDPRLIYVGAADGGIWKSVNGGVTFRPVFERYAQSIGCLAVDPSDPETVWAGTGEANVRNSVSVGTGLYRSRDGGRSWDFMGFGDSERIAAVVVDPRDGNTVTVAVLGHLWNAGHERGLFQSRDGGKTWARLLFVDDNTGCADVAVDPRDGQVIYAAMWQFRRWPWFFTSGGPGSSLYKSVDGGKTWKRLANGLPAGELGRIAIAVSPAKSSVVYATVEAKETALYRSDDGGGSWRRVNGSLAVRTRPFYFSSLEADPLNTEKVYAAGLFFSVSENGGQSFATPLSLGGGGVHSDIHPVWINPVQPAEILLGTDGGVYQSHDGGRTFLFLANLPVSQFYHVSCDMESPYNVYGGLQDNGSWYGPSSSFHSAGIANKDWVNVGSGDGFYAFPHPRDANVIYYSWQGGRLQRYDRRTRETKDIRALPGKGDPPFRYNWNAAVALSPSDPEALYLGSQFLFRSRDRGDSWERISPDLTTNDPRKLNQARSGGLTLDDTSAENHCTIVAVAESPLDHDVIWAGTDDGNLQLSRDGGTSWRNVVKNITGLPPCTWCSGVEPGRHQAGTVFAVFDGHRTGDMRPYIFRSDDFGMTWRSLAGDALRGYCHVIRQDPVDPELLFLGTEFGLFASLDGGGRWSCLRDALPPVAVTDLAIHPREHDLVIATHGLGIQIIDDLTPLRQLSPEIMAREAAVLPSRPARMRIPTYFQEFPGDGEFAGDNAPEGAFISYYLKKRHIFGELRLDVLDAQGQLVKSLPASRNAGLNRIYWDMKLKAPRTAASRGLGPMLLSGPMVDEGAYTVRLTKGGQVFSGQITLAPDPLCGYSPADRQLRQKTVMELYRMQEELAFLADSIADLLKQIAGLTEARPGAPALKLPAEVGRLRKKLAALHGTLVQSEGLFGEDRLREKVMDLFTSVSGYGGRPAAQQLDNVAYLKGAMQEAQARFARILADDLPPADRWLQGKKLPPLKLLTREEFDKKE